jgi:hypothetical protein
MPSTVLRMRMAVRGMYTMDSATITFHTPGPRAAMRAMARRMAGKAIMPSMSRITSVSSRRLKPATSPTTTPPREVRSMVVTPTRRETRLPWMTRL